MGWAIPSSKSRQPLFLEVAEQPEAPHTPPYVPVLFSAKHCIDIGVLVQGDCGMPPSKLLRLVLKHHMVSCDLSADRFSKHCTLSGTLKASARVRVCVFVRVHVCAPEAWDPRKGS